MTVSSGQDGTREPYVRAPGQYEEFCWLGGSQVRILVDAAASNGQLSIVENRSTGSFASPLHIHDVEDETFIVLEGSIRAWVGDQIHDVSAGGVALLPRGIPHAFRVTSSTGRLLVVATPGGLEELYRGAGWDLREPVPDGWSVSFGEVTELEAKRGNRILGPPPAYP